MITNLSRIITDFLISKKIISEEQREIYIYGFELVICSIISLVIVILIASITGMYYECAIYYVVFSITRLFSGGFHANTYLRCKISYIGCLLITLGLFKMMNILQPLYWLMLFIFSSLIIVHFAPVENGNKPLSETEKKRAKNITLTLIILWLVISVILYLIENSIYQMIPLTLLFIAVLMVFGEIKERRKRK